MPTETKSFGISLPYELYNKIENLTQKLNCSKAEIIRKIIDNMMFLYSLMVEFMKVNKELNTYQKFRIREIEVIQDVLTG